jgi:hypothetical protein
VRATSTRGGSCTSEPACPQAMQAANMQAAPNNALPQIDLSIFIPHSPWLLHAGYCTLSVTLVECDSAPVVTVIFTS